MTYDSLLRKVHGEAYNRKLFVIFFLNGLPNAFIITSIAMIMYAPPNQRCNLPSDVPNHIWENSTLANSTRDFFLPRDTEDENMTSKCLKYNRTYEEFVEFWNDTIDGKSAVVLGNGTKISCLQDKKYYNTEGKISLVMEFDWTCERHWLKPFASSLFMLGMTSGSFFGFVSDRFGRKKVFCFFTMMAILCTFSLSFAQSTSVFLILFTGAGVASLVNYISGFVLGAECTLPSHRNFLSISSFVSFALGYAITSLVGFLTPDWRWLMKVLGLLEVIFIANFWLVPESPRWLMANGKVEEAKKVLAMIAKYNGKEHVIKELNEAVEEETMKLLEEEKASKQLSVCEIFCAFIVKPQTLVYFVITSFSWFSIAMVYFGISLGVQAFSGNLYINNAVMGLVEIPGLLIAYFSVKYINRPLAHGGLIFLSGLCCLIASLLSDVSSVVASIAGLTGKCLNSGAFYLVYIHTAEIFPTLIRNSMMGVGSMSGRIGSILSPFLAYLGDLYGMYVPFLVFSIIACTAGLLVFLGLPETKNEELPDTIEETMNFRTLFRKCWAKHHPTRSNTTSTNLQGNVQEDNLATYI